MSKLKFMGSSHVHTLDRGDDFGGQLSEKLSKTVTFDRDNNWVVDTDEAGLSEEAVEILVASGDFKDVTDAERVPVNEHQKIFLGMKGTEELDAVREGEQPNPDVPLGSDAEDKPDGDEPAGGSTETDDTPTTTVGGSTRGAGRGARGRTT